MNKPIDADALGELMNVLPQYAVKSVPFDEFCEREGGPLDIWLKGAAAEYARRATEKLDREMMGGS